MLHKIDLEKARRKELEREQNLLLQIFSINQGRVKQRKISLKFYSGEKKLFITTKSGIIIETN